MKATTISTFLAAILLTGCVVATRSARFEGLNLSTDEFFGDIRLVKASHPSAVTPLNEVNGIRFWIVDQDNRSIYPHLENIAAQFGPFEGPHRDMIVTGSNTNREVILLMNASEPVKDGAQYYFRLRFDTSGKPHEFVYSGMIKEHVSREYFLVPIPNAGFSRAMK